MRLKKGFERLRGIAAMGVMGFGALGGGSVRATTVATSLSKSAFYGTRGVAWMGIGNTNGVLACSTVTTSNGLVIKGCSTSAFGISDAVIGNASHSTRGDAFDAALTLTVDGTMFVNPDGVVDLTGDTLTSGTVTDIVSGIDASVQYYFAPDRAVVRALYSLTNTTGAEITTDVLISGNYGSDDNTTIEASQSGDMVADATDKWFVTDDTDPSGDPVITTTRYGSGASVVPGSALTPGGGSENYGMRYAVTVPANSTRRVMVFHELGQTAAANAAAATDFESLSALDSAGLLEGLTAEQQAEIVNYGSSSSSSSDTSSGGGGAFGWLSLFAGLLLFRRRSTRLS